jgi:cell wall-associated NlpC family hydrolase
MVVDRLLGVPYRTGGRDAAGADCWGIVRLFMASTFDIRLPAYDGRRHEIEADLHASVGFWPMVGIDQVRPGDLLWLCSSGRTDHIGVAIDRRRMLHTTPSLGPRVERFDRSPWLPGRIAGIYRHPLLCKEAHP